MSTLSAPVPSSRAVLRKMLFDVAGIERIHIIGCARSGTTLLQLAMSCFSGVVLAEDESSPSHPFLGERVPLAMKLGWRRGRKFYITKRDSGWYFPKHRDALQAVTRAENIGLIMMVRDPRDVMLSRHVGSKIGPPEDAYVTPQRWYESILAGQHIFEALADHPRKLVLRYEDLVNAPAEAERRLSECFGLSRNPQALPIDRVKDNYGRLKINFGADQIVALNGLRNMSPSSIGQWGKHADALPTRDAPAAIQEKFAAFCAEYDYR